jgi:hypothetical protein
VNNQSKQERADLSQQLEAADKQLRATRQFLEEQAAEREAEREEWERRLNTFHLTTKRSGGEFTSVTKPDPNPNPDPLVGGLDPDPDPSIIKQK